MASPDEYVFQPHERPMLPGSPATPTHPPRRRAAYLGIGVLLGMTGGLNTALLTAALPQIQGALALTPSEGGWLTAIYSMTSVCMSALMIRFRQHFGLQRFMRVYLLAYVALTIVQLFVHDFTAELIVRGVGGLVGSALTTLALFYIMQALPPAKRLGAMILGFGLAQLALPLARLLAPLLLYEGEIENLFRLEAGLTLICLAAVALLRLPPSERINAIEPLDFVSILLLAPGVALLCAVLVQGRITWWDTPWLGWALAAAIPLIGAALLIEHNRARPMLNTRWMRSRNMIRFVVIATVVRVLLSEQSYGSVGLLTAVGMTSDQLITLNLVIFLASLAGLLAGVLTVRPTDLLLPLIASAVLIAIGAFMDSHASNLTRPANLYVSQALIAFAALYSMAPMIMAGVLRALSKGFSHIISFSALFAISQTVGGLAGVALLGSFQIVRARHHAAELAQGLSPVDPLVTGRLQALGGAYGRVLGDPALRQAEGGVLLAQQVTREANILAYNDVFLLIAVLAALTALWLGARWVRLRLSGINPFAEDLAALQRMRQRQ